MHHDMAIHAAASGIARAHCLAGGTRQTTLNACNIAGSRGRALMRAVVALVTQERRARFQQRGDVGTVRGMAIGAVLGRWLMLPQEGAAFFSVAGVAGFSDRVLLQQFGTGRAMGIVAIGTDNLTLTDGVVRNFLAIRALFLVAGKTDFRLRLFAQDLIDRLVNFMAIVACKTIILVLAAFPQVAHATLVTGQTLGGTILFITDCISAFLEDDIRCRTAFAARITLQVICTGAMASLACGSVRIAPDTVLGLVD